MANTLLPMLIGKKTVEQAKRVEPHRLCPFFVSGSLNKNDFAVSRVMSIFVSEKPAKGNKLAVLLLNCYPLS